jgi:hypothetical protein
MKPDGLITLIRPGNAMDGELTARNGSRAGIAISPLAAVAP